MPVLPHQGMVTGFLLLMLFRPNAANLDGSRSMSAWSRLPRATEGLCFRAIDRRLICFSDVDRRYPPCQAAPGEGGRGWGMPVLSVPYSPYNYQKIWRQNSP